MRQRLAVARVGRLATVTADERPHIVPCCFALDGDTLYTAVDDVKPKSTTELHRLDHIRRHPVASLLVDHYEDDWDALWWVRVDGRAQVAPPGTPPATAGVRRLAAKYDQYRDRPPPGPVIVIAVETWSGWSAWP